MHYHEFRVGESRVLRDFLAHGNRRARKIRVPHAQFAEMFEEVSAQHPSDSEEEKCARVAYRHLHLSPKFPWGLVYWAAIVVVVLGLLVVAARAQSNVNIDRVGGTTQASDTLKVNCVSGCTPGAPGTSIGLQVRNAADSAWVNVGFNVANLTLPVTLQASTAVIGHIICDSGCFQATQPVSGTFWQATQPVSGTFWQATQPVSGTVTANQGGAPWSEDVTDRAARLVGHVAVDSAPTTAVTGTFFQSTQPVSGTVTVNSTLQAAQSGVVPVMVMAGPPPLPQSTLANSLLYRSAMKYYCYQNLTGCR